MRRAADILGIDEIIELGWETDRLGDASEVALRERFIYHVRRVRPYAVMSFDPYGAFHEDNQDHIKVAHAVDETYWTAQFDKHHPEHFDEGLAPHGVYERWYFARRVVEVTTPVDISSTLDRKIDAALAHDTMLRHYVNQLRLQARTGGHEIADLERAQNGDLRPFMEPLLRGGARATGRVTVWRRPKNSEWCGSVAWNASSASAQEVESMGQLAITGGTPVRSGAVSALAAMGLVRARTAARGARIRQMVGNRRLESAGVRNSVGTDSSERATAWPLPTARTRSKWLCSASAWAKATKSSSPTTRSSHRRRRWRA